MPPFRNRHVSIVPRKWHTARNRSHDVVEIQRCWRGRLARQHSGSHEHPLHVLELRNFEAHQLVLTGRALPNAYIRLSYQRDAKSLEEVRTTPIIFNAGSTGGDAISQSLRQCRSSKAKPASSNRGSHGAAAAKARRKIVLAE